MNTIKCSNETSIYIIDDNYRIVHYNASLQENFPGIQCGDLCYEKLCQKQGPCEGCPIRTEGETSFVIYNKMAGSFLELGAGKIDWPGTGPCSLVMARGMDIRDMGRETYREERSRALFVPDYEIDQLTGLLRRTAFFKRTQEFIAHSHGCYCLMAVDIEHFKLFNEWYGQEEGDKLLTSVGRYLHEIQQQYGGIAGYMGGDDFVILVRDEEEAIEQVEKGIVEYVRQCQDTAGFLPAFGIYTIEDKMVSASTMYDRACIALASVKGSFANRTCRYDSHMMRKLEENHKLLSEIQKGLEQREFTFYAQPKCNLCTGKIVGLEALVRWDHPVRGIVSPGEFIPILENNGLITKLDLYLWEEVCRKLRSWIDSGLRVVPVSVNVSRMDIYAVDVASVFRKLIEKYSLEPRLLEVEITESAYVEEYKVITGVVESLRESGFTVLMDDFGSGYSSLNMLRDVNVDVLKIDMKFLEMDDDTIGKGVEILEAITRLGNIMGMRMIAEGIETKEQVDFLMNMGCSYGQGYYFFRPMPIERYEPLLSDEGNFDYRGIKAKQMDRISLKNLFEDDFASDVIMNNIMGAVAFYELKDGELELIRVNDQYCALTGSNAVDLELQRKSILRDTREADRPRVLNIFTQAYENPFTGATGDVRRKKADGTYMWMHMRVFFLREQDGRRMFYGAVSDVTEQRLREQRLEVSLEALSAMAPLSGKEPPYMSLTGENRGSVASILTQMIPMGMMGSYCEEGFPLYFANSDMVKLLGYHSFEELEQGISGLVLNAVHPDDRAQVIQDIGTGFYPGLEYATIYRMCKKDGTWFWVLDKGLVVQGEKKGLSIVSRCTDITEMIGMGYHSTDREHL